MSQNQKAPNQLSPFLIEQYENDARKLWEKFYKRNGVNFFKDRHYLEKEFPELLEMPNPLILEVGCGVGNSCIPLLETFPNCRIHAIDFSHRAIDLLRNHPVYDTERIGTSVVDCSEPKLRDRLSPSSHSFDYCTLVFVLSSISPIKMPSVVENLGQILKPGVGRVLFRDYAVGDLAEVRFQQSRQKKKLDEHFYLRGDGTRCYYFTEDVVKSLFEAQGFVCQRIITYQREIENRRKKIKMHRKWIQGVFLKTRPSS